MDAIEQFNAIVKAENHYELQIYSFSPDKLILAGNYELDFNHTIELHFEHVHFYCGKQYFTVDEEAEFPLQLGPEISDYDKLNFEHSIEQGYELYAFATAEGQVLVAAKSMELVKRVVLYYKPENPRPEEVAYWIK